MHAIKEASLRIVQFWRLDHPLGKEDHTQGTTQRNRSLEGREEGWRESKITCEDYTESWLAVRLRLCIIPMYFHHVG